MEQSKSTFPIICRRFADSFDLWRVAPVLANLSCLSPNVIRSTNNRAIFEPDKLRTVAEYDRAEPDRYSFP